MTGPVIVAFTTALNDAFRDELEVNDLLLRLNRRFADYVSPNQPFPRQLQQLVAAANSQGWIPQLVGEAVGQNPSNALIKHFLATYPDWDGSARAASADPCESLRVFGGKAFIGRSVFRKLLIKMRTRDTKNILLVTSDRRKVGKTYSKEMLYFVCRNILPPYRFAYVDLDTQEYDPGTLARAVASQLHLDAAAIPSRGQQQATRWNQELSAWLVPEMVTPNSAFCWIVLDGFRLRMPTEEIQDLIAQIAQRVQSAPDYRLILVGYTYPLPFAVSSFMFREKVAPIQNGEVRQHLRQVYEQRHGEPPSEQKLTEYVEAVYQKVADYVSQDPEMADDQLLLNAAVTEAVDLILEG